jgi:hypothetical protein
MVDNDLAAVDQGVAFPDARRVTPGSPALARV